MLVSSFELIFLAFNINDLAASNHRPKVAPPRYDHLKHVDGKKAYKPYRQPKMKPPRPLIAAEHRR